MVVKDEIKSKLEYLGLDLDNISESLIKSFPLEFTISRLKDDKDLKVYKYIPIEDIEILLTPHNKGEDLKTRYNDALPISRYLDSKTENPEDYARYLEFINMFKYFREEQIKDIEEEQKRYIENIPFDIRYDRSHMWNIYYDDKTKKYFMLVCTKEGDFGELFYIIKKKIEIDRIDRLDEVVEGNIVEEHIVKEEKDEAHIVEEKKEFEEYFDEEDRAFNEESNENNTINNNEENSRNNDDNHNYNENDNANENDQASNTENKNEEIAETNRYIYAPINYVSMSEKYIVPNELLEIENYLWYFTKKWPITYEYYDMKNNYSLIIKGETKVYDRVESDYKFIIRSKEDAIKIYKHIKALFMLETATDNYFGFKPEIKRNFELQLTYDGMEIGFDDIPDLIFKKYNEILKEIEVLNNENKSKTVKINMLKDDMLKKEQLYKDKQKEIVQYLECKTSFTKKVKYFFKKSSRVTKTDMNKNQIKEIKEKIEADRKEVEVDYTVIDTVRALEKKEFYTIDDFIFVYSLYEKLNRKVSELVLDIRGIKLALLNINNKLSNAETYLEEIDFHKKSIFEFWKFANKDKKLTLEEAGLAGESDETKKEVEIPKDRVFNFDMDTDATAEYMDEIQRRKLSKEELNAVFLLDIGFIEYINMLKLKDIDEYAMMAFLEDLKKEYKDESKYVGEVFDVFGTVKPSIKTRYLKTNEFRELDRDKFKIIGINQNMDKFKFLEKLTENSKYIDEAMLKIKTNIELPIYKAIPSIEKLGPNKLEIFNIDVEEELTEYKGVGSNLNLIKINLPKDSSVVFYTNIIYYENQNDTLPLGMDKGKKVLLDLSKFKLEEKKREKIVINKYFNNYTSEKVFKNVNVIEYDIITK